MKKLMPIGGVLLLAAAAAGGWYFFMGEPADPHAEAPTAEMSDEIIYVRMGPISVPVFRDGALYAQLLADFHLEVADDQVQSEAFRRGAELRNAYLREFYDMADRIARGHDRIDLDRLKARLEVITAQVLGPGAVRAVLLHNVVVGKV